MADTAAERLAKALDLPGIWENHVRGAQRAIDAGWVHRDDLLAQGWTPPPDPWETVAQDAWDALLDDEHENRIDHSWDPEVHPAQRRLLDYFRDALTADEARAIAARIEEGT